MSGRESNFAAASAHRVPRAQVVDRIDFITASTRGKSVIDLGFVDKARMSSKQALGTWLHARIAEQAATAVGIDSDVDGVQRARELGYDAHAADCESEKELAALALEPAQIVVAGELIEHLDQPGRFLEAVKALVGSEGTLLITTPNACSLTNFVGSAMRREFVNPDHVSWYSWHTLRTLLDRHDWAIESVAYYGFPKISVPGSAHLRERLRTGAFNSFQRAARPLFKLRPPLADGIIVSARRA